MNHALEVDKAYEPGNPPGPGKKDCPEWGSLRPICGVFCRLLGKTRKKEKKLPNRGQKQ